MTLMYQFAPVEINGCFLYCSFSFFDGRCFGVTSQRGINDEGYLAPRIQLNANHSKLLFG